MNFMELFLEILVRAELIDIAGFPLNGRAEVGIEIPPWGWLVVFYFSEGIRESAFPDRIERFN
jgi:hypothetical protein